jgi:hypothetical protein
MASKVYVFDDSDDLICGDRHLYALTYRRRWRDALRKTYWIRCWECDLNEGPFTTRDEAMAAEWAIEHAMLRVVR